MKKQNRTRVNRNVMIAVIGAISILLQVLAVVFSARSLSAAALILSAVFFAAVFRILLAAPDVQAAAEEPIGWRRSDRELLGFIERVLKGCENQRVSGISIPAQSPFFVVFGVDIVSVPGGDSADIKQAARYEMQVCDTLAAAFSHHSFWPMNIDGMLICVVNLAYSSDIPTGFTDSELIPTLRKAAKDLGDLGILVRIATSGLTIGVDNLSMAYQDTLDIFNELLIRAPDQTEQVFVADPKAGIVKAGQMVRGQRERLYYNYVTTGEFSQAKNLLLQIVREEAARNAFTINLKRMTENRLEWTLDILSGVIDPSQEHELRQKAHQIPDTAYYDELADLVSNWFDCLSRHPVPKADDDLIRNVITYINEHCCSSDLSVGGISDHFSVNASYLSTTFHSEVGIRLIDYIHQQRLRRVKQLLRETRLTMAQIAESTGYYSTLSMSRAFKRYEGVTPSAYRSATL